MQTKVAFDNSPNFHATQLEEFVNLSQKYIFWLKDKVFPKWGSVGVNDKTGGSYENILLSGSADLHSDVRVRVQARQAFSFAIAGHREWFLQGERLGVRLMNFAWINAARNKPEVGFYHRLNANNEVIDTKWDLYDHAFFLLAYGRLYQVTQNVGYLNDADKLFEYMDTRFSSQYGGWLEGNYEVSVRRQNPHMHLFEAFLTLYEVSKKSSWLQRAQSIYNLFEIHFFDEESGLLKEFFEENWSGPETAKGEIVEPGHMVEWVWLLDWYQRLSGTLVPSAYLNSLYQRALEHGRSESGLLYSEISLEGKVLDGSKRCWAMTELVKAGMVHIRMGTEGALETNVYALQMLFKYYLSEAVDGLYSDLRDFQDISVGQVAPASTLYHLTTLGTELEDFLSNHLTKTKVAR